MDSQVFAHEKALKIWIWCLMKASYKKRSVPIKIGKGTSIIDLQPGEFLFGRFKAEEQLCIDGSTIYKWMQKFQDVYDMITIKSNNHYSIVTIVNWELYQKENGESNSQQTAKEQPSNNQVTAVEHIQESKKGNKNTYIDKAKEFYENELNENPNEDYKLFIEYIFGNNIEKKPFEKVLKIPNQLNYDGFLDVKARAKQANVKLLDIVNDLNNYDKANKYTSLHRTLQKWIK
jgi:hypothetical protein